MKRGARPAVSALVVNYHAYGELDACLASLSRQQLEMEVIVVDHETDEGSRRKLEQAYPLVRWLPTRANPGFAAGVNAAARPAEGDYLYLVNPDAVVEPATARVLVEWLERHADVAVVGSMVRDVDGTLQGSARRFPNVSTAFGGRTTFLTRWFPGNAVTQRNLMIGPHVTSPIDVDWVSGASMMIRRRAFEAVQGMDEGFFLYWEDADLCKRLRDVGWRTMYHPGASVMHLCGRSSRASSRSIVAFHDSAYRYFTKHAGGAGHLARPLAYGALKLRLALKLLGGRRHRAADLSR